MSRTVLVINSGSSSIKYQLIDPDSGESLSSGVVERIGEESGRITHKYAGEKHTLEAPVPDHEVGLRQVIAACGKFGPDLAAAGVVAVGHRVVQGGSRFDKAIVLDEASTREIAELIPLAPLHNPANVTGIRTALEVFPDIPHVAIFDTAFFSDMPAYASTYALDKDVAERYKIRRYGFHGTSHAFVSREVARHLGRDDLKQIVLHLGNGASASAIDSGHPIDTSMGMTPLEGLMMGTRTGDIDPAIAFHLARVGHMRVGEIDSLFNERSGLKGVCGHNDMREVRELAAAGQADARLALDIYGHRIRKYIGSYAAALNGLDVITFTAGVGENDSDLRREVLEGLSFLGIELDRESNAQRTDGIRAISTPASKVTVLVVPTNEELSIARQAAELIES
ncbi:acetate kinase [Raineyella antarctica]|uniref:Acetate kinase n=1 Tax=Raineyella antarctica TaxID=1577474 RepID=A0A1G6GEB7_9ACTN|nr:acetate kinase [Raineyella antarctica]SDB80317.1 acetate kinase [Raineyella antarctica]